VKKRNRKQNVFDLYDVSLSSFVWTSTLHRDQSAASFIWVTWKLRKEFETQTFSIWLIKIFEKGAYLLKT